MKSGMLSVALLVAMSFAQVERWVYKYNGSGNADDMALSVIFGDDGNIYAAGQSRGNGTGLDFTVISLAPDGSERWVYIYNGPGNTDDIAKQILYGSDGNIYACGQSIGETSSNDFTVISLTQSGTERWVYRYNGTGNGPDEATSIDYGLDGNIYVAGYCFGVSSYQDFIVTSLDTAGSERWTYIYDAGQYPGYDFARSIVCGSDTNIYAAGQIYFWGTLEDFAMVSLDSAGLVRWVGLFDGNTISPPDYANAIAYGLDNKPYAAGLVGYWANGRPVCTVMNRQNAGPFGWVYEYQGSAVLRDEAYAITYGADYNVYTAGYTTNNVTSRDFTIFSLTDDGDFNWIYLYNGTGNGNDEALDIEYGLDGYIYGCGSCIDVIGQENLLTVRLDTSGAEKWIYTYDGSAGDVDKANSLIYGSDDNIYIAGGATDSLSTLDFIVISLDTTSYSVDEKGNQGVPTRKPIFPTYITGAFPLFENKQYKIFNITGRQIHTLNPAPGIYFIEVDGKITRKVIKVR